METQTRDLRKGTYEPAACPQRDPPAGAHRRAASSASAVTIAGIGRRCGTVESTVVGEGDEVVDELFPADSEACDCRLSASLYLGRRYRELDFGATVGGAQLEVVPRGEQRPAVGIERIESETEPSRPVDREHSPARVVLDAVALTQGELGLPSVLLCSQECSQAAGRQRTEMDRHREQRACSLACDPPPTCKRQVYPRRGYRAKLALAVLTADRASPSEPATPQAPRPGRVTDQYQPRRGPRHHSLTQLRRMKSIVVAKSPPLQAAVG